MFQVTEPFLNAGCGCVQETWDCYGAGWGLDQLPPSHLGTQGSADSQAPPDHVHLELGGGGWRAQ